MAYLSRREHSRLELQRKLARFSDDPDEINAVLDQLQHENWQSDQRFAESFSRRNAAKHGSMRILNDLCQNGVSESGLAAIAAGLRSSEPERARQVWAKKFSSLPQDQREYAKQYRFMLSRGFANDIIHAILSGRSE